MLAPPGDLSGAELADGETLPADDDAVVPPPGPDRPVGQHHVAPVDTCPIRSCPIHSCPIHSCPIHSCPIHSCPIHSRDVVHTEHDGSRPTEAGLHERAIPLLADDAAGW